MVITREQLDDIKKAEGYSTDEKAYEWIVKTFPENVFFDNVEIMELISEARKELKLNS